MKVNVIFEECDYDALLAAKELANKIYLSAESESEAESIAKSAVDSLADLIYFMARQDEDISSYGECAPCAGDCAECHCEECIEDEPIEQISPLAAQMIAKVREILGEDDTPKAHLGVESALFCHCGKMLFFQHSHTAFAADTHSKIA